MVKDPRPSLPPQPLRLQTEPDCIVGLPDSSHVVEPVRGCREL